MICRENSIYRMFHIIARRSCAQLKSRNIFFCVSLQAFYLLRCTSGTQNQDTCSQGIERSCMSRFHPFDTQLLRNQIANMGQCPKTRQAY